MVIAHKVQKAMHGEMRKMMQENTVFFLAFARQCLRRKHNVAEHDRLEARRPGGGE